jgi:hypothetical protein
VFQRRLQPLCVYSQAGFILSGIGILQTIFLGCGRTNGNGSSDALTQVGKPLRDLGCKVPAAHLFFFHSVQIFTSIVTGDAPKARDGYDPRGRDRQLMMKHLRKMKALSADFRSRKTLSLPQWYHDGQPKPLSLPLTCPAHFV